MYFNPDEHGSQNKMIQVKITGNATAKMYSSGFSRRVETGSPEEIVYLPFV